MPDGNSTTLEQFRTKHGQAAYNTLIKAVEGSAKKPLLTNRSLTSMAREFMRQPQQALTNRQSPRIRGSADVPLNSEGIQTAGQRAQEIAAKGGFDMLLSSPLQRARNTAVAIAKHNNTPIQLTDHALPWKLGIFEGEPVDQVKHFIAKLANNHPQEKAPGRSPVSTQDGESFNDFKDRFIGKFMKPMMEAHAQDPRSKIGVVTHLRDILAVKSWIEHGARQDLQFNHHDINYEAKTSKEEIPGSIFRVAPDGSGKWAFEDAHKELSTPGQFNPGIYLIRHGATDWNGNGTGQTS